ncbi:MAG: hypothetical protein RIQ33_1969 [Bacteroidota bacterium]
MLKPVLIFLLMLFMSTHLWAQIKMEDSLHYLKQVNIQSNRLSNFSAGNKIVHVDTATMQQYQVSNLSDLLNQESSIFVKSYGMGSLATTSFRGGSAHQTAILWNGFNIGSPMNGMADLSLIPNGIANQISLQYGGASALWGSGAIGGSIHLNNNAEFNKGIINEIKLSHGSFKNNQQQISIVVSQKKWIIGLKYFNSAAQNNFEYNSIYSNQKTKIVNTNAQLKSKNILFENYFKLNKNQTLNLFFWYQNTERNIPPTMLQSSNNSSQTDIHYRVTSEWKLIQQKSSNYIRAAYFNESLLYQDKAYNYHDTSKWHNVIIEAERKIKWNNCHQLNVGFNNTNIAAKASTFYSKIQNQNRVAIFASYQYQSNNKKVEANISSRYEWLQNYKSPFVGSMGATYKILKWITINASAAKVFRLPTMNDMYWYPGGNAALLPESGYTEELGYRAKYDKRKISFISDVTWFNKNINNWIVWLPGLSYWSPQNVMKVWSRGVETNHSIIYKINTLKFHLSVISNYVVSTNELAKTLNDESVNKQLLYVPMYSGRAKFSMEYHQLTFSYQHQYTGYRYTSTDNTEYLKPYNIGSAYGTYSIEKNKYKILLFIQCNNIWNVEYQTLLNRAMPGFNFNKGIAFQFHQSNKK